MISYGGTIRVAACAAVGLLVAAGASAGPVEGGTCQIGKWTATAVLDVNDNRVWDGVAGGDANFTLAGFDAGDVAFVNGNFPGAGSDAVARYATSTATYIDQNQNYAWDGAATDRTFFFAPGQGAQTPVVGDWGMLGNDQWGLYNATTDNFLLDKNDNGVFDGNAGGDAFFSLSNASGPGTPITGDWDGDGQTDTGKVVGTNNNFILDLNGNQGWDGNAGGDFNGFFAPGQAGAIPVVGDWNGDGTDEIGIYTTSDAFWLDLNGNRVWDGAAGGDLNLVLSAASGVGIPMVSDWNGDGTDDTGKLVGTNANFITDLNGNHQWDGNAGGDFNGFFQSGGGSGQPLPGVYPTAP